MSLSKPLDAASLLVSEKTLNVFLHGISGAFAGCLSTLLLYPIENVKTRMQAMAKAHSVPANGDTENPEIEKNKAGKRIIDVVLEIMEKEGPKGFYKGIVPYLVGTLASFGIYFFWYEFFKDIFIKDKFSLMGYTATAFLAGSICTTATNPIWVVHTRILLEKGKNPGVLETIMNIIKQEGFEGFFKGLGASYVLVLNPIIQFIVYEYLKKKFEHTKYQSAMVFLAGAISKAMATFFTYPYQTLKTNLQANKHRNVGQLELLNEILKTKGFKGFFGGFGAKLSQTVINSALMLVIYERIQALVKQLLIVLLTKRGH